MTCKNVHLVLSVLYLVTGCTTPNPNYRRPGSDASPDGACVASNRALRCDGTHLVRCNADGTAETSEPCALGCNAAELRCADVAPSNGLAKFLDGTKDQLDINLGESAAINTDTGVVTVGSNPIPVTTETIAQSGALPIRLFVVRSLIAKAVVVTGKNPIAIVSNGDIAIAGVFSVSADNSPGPGAYNENGCEGQDPPQDGSGFYAFGGVGGGGFGSPGAQGGLAEVFGLGHSDSNRGGFGGMVTGNEQLVPLRGGCNSGDLGSSRFAGQGGGAVQLVSRTRIVVSGTVAANGSAGDGGGSGGGILLEAPIVEVTVSGRVVANGGGGSAPYHNTTTAEDGRFDNMPARGGAGEPDFLGRGGNGAAGSTAATNGWPINGAIRTKIYGGGGGGGVGRIRVNTGPGGQRTTGLYSPAPYAGTLATR